MFWSMSITVGTSLCDGKRGGRETITNKDSLSRETIGCIMWCKNVLLEAAGMMRTSFLDTVGYFWQEHYFLRCHGVTPKGHFVIGFHLVSDLAGLAWEHVLAANDK